MSNWVKYRNGNYDVILNLENGTKIRRNDLDSLIPEYPESMDVKITNRCQHNCAMCHENSTKDGVHGDIMNAKFIDTLHPYTELAIGGGNPLDNINDFIWNFSLILFQFDNFNGVFRYIIYIFINRVVEGFAMYS